MAGEFRILSIDGGGLLGTYSAAVLEKLEELYGKKIHEHFDMFAGTSSGAIIASSLACGYTAKSLREFYETKGRIIFHNNIGGSAGDKIRMVKQVFFGAKHSNKELIEQLHDVLKDRTLRSPKSYLCVSTFNVTKGITRVFKTPHSDTQKKHRNIPLYKAVACSASAPTFLPEYFPGFEKEDNDGYVDGGTWAQNPALVGLTEALKHFVGPKKKFKTVRILSVASFAESLKRKKYLRSVRDWNWGLDFMGLFMTAQQKSCSYMIGNILNNDHSYLRIEPEVTQQMAQHFTPDNTDPIKFRVMAEEGWRSAEAAFDDPKAKKILDAIFKKKKLTSPRF